MTEEERLENVKKARDAFYRDIAESTVRIRNLPKNEQEHALRQAYLAALTKNLEHVREKHDRHPGKEAYVQVMLNFLTATYRSVASQLGISGKSYAQICFSVYNDAAKQYPELLRVIRATST